MSLAEHQRAVAALVVDGRVTPPVAHLAATDELALLREIGTGWQTLGLARHCPLTWRALGARGRRDAVTARFLASRGLSPHLHVQARQFLAATAADADAVVAAVARFERSLLAREEPAPPVEDPVVIDWPCDPVPLLTALAAGDAELPVDPEPHRSTARAAEPAVLTVTR